MNELCLLLYTTLKNNDFSINFTMELLTALQTNDARTENGMVTNSSTLNACLNLFFQIGAMRGQDKGRVIAAFTKAFVENPLTAMRMLFWARDVRGGAGERQIFRDIIAHLAQHHTEVLAKNLSLISEYGRWDDLLILFGTKLDTQAKTLIADALKREDGLCAKWMPRKGKEAIALERFMKLSPKAYRQMLVKLTNVVEQLMCSKDWSVIKYEHLPSLAMARYSKAFDKHDSARFDAYKNSDTTKINAGAVYPYDILKTLRFGDMTLANKQWGALPNWLVDAVERLLVVADVSGSMDQPVGGNKNLSAMDVCISLAMYIAERNVGKFKDAFLTFSSRPQLQILKGNLQERYSQLARADWSGNTDLEATFMLVLNQAVKNQVPLEEMPTAILIMSDMEFDTACNRNHTAYDMIADNYAKAGYKMPKIIFWNLCSRNDNFPVQMGKNGASLISGFSPSILKSVLTGEDMSPMTIMNKTVHAARYEPVTV